MEKQKGHIQKRLKIRIKKDFLERKKVGDSNPPILNHTTFSVTHDY